MTNGTRSPFGELVHYHRHRLGLSRRKVADRLIYLAATGAVDGSVSVRTLGRIERVGPPADWHTPHMQAVHALAAVFGLDPGSAEHEVFIAAAIKQSVRQTSDTHIGPDLDHALDATLEHAVEESRFFPAGRETQMERISAAIDAAVAGRPGAVFVGAAPGVGKTSLIAAACRQALGRHDHLAVLWTASPDRHGPPLHWEPFRAMLGLMAGDLAIASEHELLTSGNAAELVRRIPAAAQALVAESQELVGWLLTAGTLANTRLEHALEPELRRQLDHVLRRQVDTVRPDTPPDEAIFRAVARYAGEGPVLLVLEDLHWADDATVAVLSYVLARMAGRHLPLVVIGSYRPAELVDAEGKAHALTRVLRQTPRRYPGALIDLATAVGGEHGRAFVEAVVSQLDMAEPVPVVEALFQRTAGLPLVVVNMLRLLEQEEITPEVIHALPLPEEVEMIFAEQVERLDPEVGELLHAASVQGDVFWAEPVMQMLGLDRDRFIALVDSRLVRQFRMLESRAARTVAGRAMHQYAFSHALLQDYLVDSLATLERERWHERTATALIDLLGEKDHDATPQIAIHLERAGLRERAAMAWIHAGTYSVDHREFDRARAAFERVLALDVHTTDLATHLQALVGIGNCFSGQGDLSRARRSLEDVLKQATSANLPVMQGHALESLAEVDFAAGEMQRGVDRLMTVIDIWSRADQEEVARAMANIGYLLYGLGRYEEAMTFARRGAERAERMGDTRVWISAQIAYANCLMDLGLYADAVAIYESCIPPSQSIGDAHRENLCLINIALAALERGDWETCGTLARRVLASVPEPSPLLVSTGEYDLGYVAEVHGDFDGSEAHYTRCCASRERNGQEALLIDALAGLLRVAIKRGDLERVGELRATIAGRIAVRGLDGIEHVARMYLALMEASELLGEPDRVEGYLRDAVTFLHERASRLSDPAHRTSYLTNPPAHRRLMALARDGDT